MSKFSRATKKNAFLRLALTGPSGSGKTYTALSVATAMGGKIALIDTERGSASKYADLFEFDTLELQSFHPQRYIEAIKEAETTGYDIIIIDSLSHAWIGKDGALELVDRIARASKSQNSYVAWRDVTPLQNTLVDTMIGAKAHIIASMRTKTEYVQEKDDRGRTSIRKVGLAPIQREGLEHEFDIVGELDHQNTLVVSKTRCPDLQGAVIEKPGREIAEVLVAWLKGEPTADGQLGTPSPPPGPPKMPESMHRALEAMIGKSGISRVALHQYLAEIGWLEVSETGPHLTDLTPTRGSYILGNWEGMVNALGRWERESDSEETGEQEHESGVQGSEVQRFETAPTPGNKKETE